MNNGSLIVHVDETAKAALDEVTDGISSAIADELGKLTEPMEDLKTAMEDISQKFGSFSALGSSMEKLRELAHESCKLREEILPLQSDIALLQRSLGGEAESIRLLLQANDRMLQETGAKLQDQGAALAETVSSAGANYSNAMQKLQNVLRNNAAILERLEKLGTSQLSVFNALKSVMTEDSERMATRLGLIEERLIRQDEELDSLNQKTERVLLTLDIIVNLVTPFWKKL